MNLDEFEHLVLKALELGVPTDVTAELFELPVDTCAELQKRVRVERTGTSDLSDYLEGLQWRALEQADRMLRTGSSDQAVKIVNAVFGRQLQVAGRRPSSSMEEQRAKILEAFGDIRESEPVATTPGRFVVGNVGVDRRANRDDDEDE